MLHESMVKIARVIVWLLIVYATYVFLQSVGITPYDLIDQVHEIAYYFFASLGA